MDLDDLQHLLDTMKLLGSKGTTGTQASFMELFKGDADKIRAVDASIAKEMGFAPEAVIPVSGQTYSRKVDAFILNALAGIGQSCMKFATDLRLLANFKEMEEPFEKNQIGSSAMPYKRNPMRCERICALSRYLMVDVLNPSFTTGTQWFERTLDDSANKRVAMAEGFLAADAILNIMLNVTDGIVVYPKVVRSRLMAELPFMASENIMMQAVEKGGNRQELHERLRQHAIAAGKQVKEEGLPNDMVDRVAADPAFGLTKEEIVAGLVPENFVGRAPQQVEEFIANVLQPIFDANPRCCGTARFSERLRVWPGSFLLGHGSGHSIARPTACGSRVPPQRTVLGETPGPLNCKIYRCAPPLGRAQLCYNRKRRTYATRQISGRDGAMHPERGKDPVEQGTGDGERRGVQKGGHPAQGRGQRGGGRCAACLPAVRLPDAQQA